MKTHLGDADEGIKGHPSEYLRLCIFSAYQEYVVAIVSKAIEQKTQYPYCNIRDFLARSPQGLKVILKTGVSRVPKRGKPDHRLPTRDRK